MPMPDGGPAPARLATRPSTVSTADIAWIAALPCALLGIAAIAYLGPPLGHALVDHATDQLWPPEWWETNGHPEPVKQGRYVVAVLAPLLLVGAILAGARRRVALREPAVRALAWTSHAGLLALVALALIEQHPVVANRFPAASLLFGPLAVAAAAALTGGAVVAMRRHGAVQRVAALTAETQLRKRVALAAALVVVAMVALRAVATDALAADGGVINLPWTFNDALAVLDGRTPLVDYHAIYSKLFPYLTAPVLAWFGTTVFVYTAFMAALDALALLAGYAVFRLVTRSSLLALGLLVPFAAMSDFDPRAAPGVASPMMLAAMWPMRFGGVYLLAWLTARHLDGRSPRRPWVLFLVGGLAAINSVEFGIAMVLATLAALLCARPPASVRDVLRLGAVAAGGMLAAVGLLCALTLARAGVLPSLAMFSEWPRIFTTLGWFALPLPTWDLHIALYLSFVAAMALAVVRLARGAPDALLTGMLAWSGVFGLLVGSYFVGRPDVYKLTGMFSAWSFALSMLTVACVRALRDGGWRRPSLPQLLVLFGFALSLCSLARVTLPQDQISRLWAAHPPARYLAAADRFVERDTREGETVVILLPMSFRIAHDLRLRNVAPYTFMNAVVTRSQMQTLLSTLARERVRKVYVPAPNALLIHEGDIAPAQLHLLAGSGYVPVAIAAGMIELRRA